MNETRNIPLELVDLMKIKRELELSLDFPMPIIKSGRLLPSLGKVSFLNKYPEEINHGKKRRVAIFIGCLANYNYTNIGDSLIEILKELKIDAFIPKEQICCSAPAYLYRRFLYSRDPIQKEY